MLPDKFQKEQKRGLTKHKIGSIKAQYVLIWHTTKVTKRNKLVSGKSILQNGILHTKKR